MSDPIMRYSVPPVSQKTRYVESPLLLKSSKGQRCVRCESSIKTPTVVAAHYTGQRQHLYGKGKSIKGHDCLTADLCDACHAYFDQPVSGNDKDARSEEFLHCIALTTVRRFQRGVLVVAPMSEWDQP